MPPAPRPWWGNPLVWLGVSAVSLILGLVVAPHFLPGVFIFLPFIWMGRWSRAPRCPGCGRPAQPGHEFCPSCGTRLGGDN